MTPTPPSPVEAKLATARAYIHNLEAHQWVKDSRSTTLIANALAALADAVESLQMEVRARDQQIERLMRGLYPWNP